MSCVAERRRGKSRGHFNSGCPSLSLRKIKMAGAAADRRRIREGRSKEGGERTDGRISIWHFKYSYVRGGGSSGAAKQVPVRNAKLIRRACRERESARAQDLKFRRKIRGQQKSSRRCVHSFALSFVNSATLPSVFRPRPVHKNIGRGMSRCALCQRENTARLRDLTDNACPAHSNLPVPD